jgi:hypothetical protein
VIDTPASVTRHEAAGLARSGRARGQSVTTGACTSLQVWVAIYVARVDQPAKGSSDHDLLPRPFDRRHGESRRAHGWRSHRCPQAGR